MQILHSRKGRQGIKGIYLKWNIGSKNNQLKILCDVCEWPEEIDLKRAKEAKERAEQRLAHKDGIDIKRAQLALNRALARINLLK